MKNCRICQIIRSFIMAVFLLIVVALMSSDKLHYLSFVTSWNAAILILILGFLIFIFKLLEYFKSKISDLLQILQKFFFSGTKRPYEWPVKKLTDQKEFW